MTSSLMGLTNCRVVATSRLRFAQQGGEELGRLAKGSALRQELGPALQGCVTTRATGCVLIVPKWLSLSECGFRCKT